MQTLFKLITACGLLVAAASAFAQSDAPFTVPASGKPHLIFGRRAFQTKYVIFDGQWKHRNVDDILESVALHGPAQSSIPGYHPADILDAYGISPNSGARAIAIIDAFDLPTNLSDFNTFSKEFGLPTETSTVATLSTNKVFQVVYPSGSKPASNGDWGGEIALDMEWAHAIAPKAKIYLVECASDDESDLFAGVQYVNSHFPDVGEVSMSFGGTEDGSETQNDSTFTAPNVVYLAASGDAANTVTYPATSPNVISVGGTTLKLSGGSVLSESYWYSDSNDAGAGGVSRYEPRPSYQNPYAAIVGTVRGTNDLAADADPNTGCALYDSTPIPSDKNVSGWLVFGGTSLSCPICAGIMNARGYNQTTSFAEIQLLYSLAGSNYFRDITSGSNGVLKAAKGYDLVTGLGSPLGLFVTHAFNLTAGGIAYGAALNGTPANMIAKDNRPYTIRSAASGTHQVAEIYANFGGSALTSTVVGGTITVTGTCGITNTAVFAYNPVTKVYDSIGALDLGQNSTTATVNSPNLAKYVSSSGVIQLKMVGSIAQAAQFHLSIDQITFSVGTSK